MSLHPSHEKLTIAAHELERWGKRTRPTDLRVCTRFAVEDIAGTISDPSVAAVKFDLVTRKRGALDQGYLYTDAVTSLAKARQSGCRCGILVRQSGRVLTQQTAEHEGDKLSELCPSRRLFDAAASVRLEPVRLFDSADAQLQGPSVRIGQDQSSRATHVQTSDKARKTHSPIVKKMLVHLQKF